MQFHTNCDLQLCENKSHTIQNIMLMLHLYTVAAYKRKSAKIPVLSSKEEVDS